MLTESYIDERSMALLRYFTGKLGDPRQAEELAQEVWVRVLGAMRHGSEPIRDMDRFLWKVAKYVWCRHLRGSMRQVGWVSVEETDLPDATDVAQDVAEADETQRQLSWIRRRVVRLGEKQREIMLLFYLDGLSLRDIARRLNVSEATVKWHLYDTRRKLKEESSAMSEQDFLYRPRRLHMGINGLAMQQPDTVFIENSPVKQNLCAACYREPRTLTQLAEYLGIPAGYLEPDLRWLVEKEFLTETPQGYLTAFLITTNREMQARYALHKKYRTKVADALVDGLLAAEPAIRAIGFHGCDKPMNELLWLLIYRFFNCIPLYVEQIPAPFRTDGGRYWPLGFDCTDDPDLIPAVDTTGWAHNGTMYLDGFRWSGLYNFGSSEIEQLIFEFTPEWKRLKDTLRLVIDRGGDITGLGEQERLDLATLAHKGFLTVTGDKCVPNFCVFTHAQEKQLIEQVFQPIQARVEASMRSLIDDLRPLCREQLPKHLKHLENQSLFQAIFHAGYLTYIFAFNDGKLYVPKDAADGMFLTFMYCNPNI